MPEVNDNKAIRNTTGSKRSLGRSLRMLSNTRVYYVGAGLIKLRTAERRVDRAWRELEAKPVLERIPSMLTLWRVLDGILDRRRILCGDPLPSRNGAGRPRQLLDMPISEPEPIVPAGESRSDFNQSQTGVD